MEKKMEEMNLEQLDEVSGGIITSIDHAGVDIASQLGKMDELTALLASGGIDITKIDLTALIAKVRPLLAKYKDVKNIPVSEIIELAKAFIR